MDRRINVTNYLIVVGLMAFLLGSGLSTRALAKDYPSKSIRLIYPFPAGSGGDIASRFFADALSRVLGSPVKVTNVAGSRGTIGAAKVAKARKDGYILGSLPIGPALTQTIFSEGLPYSTADLDPICQFMYAPLVIVAGAHTPYKTMEEFIDYAKKNPGKVIFAHSGLGTVPYMSMLAIEEKKGITWKGVPFKGLKPGLTAAVGGHIDVAPAFFSAAISFQKAGKLRILTSFSSKRLEMAPDIPTVEEIGIKTYPEIWTGIFAPKGLDPSILKKLDEACTKAAQDEEFIKTMGKAQQPILYRDKKEFQMAIEASEKYYQAMKAKSK